jgi:hypothetical protein
MFERPMCHDCEEGVKLTPDGKCVKECHEAGFVEQEGHCQPKCDYKWGPNKGLGVKDVCHRCETDNCESCEFRE